MVAEIWALVMSSFVDQLVALSTIAQMAVSIARLPRFLKTSHVSTAQTKLLDNMSSLVDIVAIVEIHRR